MLSLKLEQTMSATKWRYDAAAAAAAAAAEPQWLHVHVANAVMPSSQAAATLWLQPHCTAVMLYSPHHHNKTGVPAVLMLSCCTRNNVTAICVLLLLFTLWVTSSALLSAVPCVTSSKRGQWQYQMLVWV